RPVCHRPKPVARGARQRPVRTPGRSVPGQSGNGHRCHFRWPPGPWDPDHRGRRARRRGTVRWGSLRVSWTDHAADVLPARRRELGRCREQLSLWITSGCAWIHPSGGRVYGRRKPPDRKRVHTREGCATLPSFTGRAPPLPASRPLEAGNSPAAAAVVTAESRCTAPCGRSSSWGTMKCDSRLAARQRTQQLPDRPADGSRRKEYAMDYESRMYELEFPAPQLSSDDGSGPVLVHGLEGYSDAGHAVRLATTHLRESLESELVASFDVDELQIGRAHV